MRLQISCGSYTFLPYVLQECGSCVLTNANKESPENKLSLAEAEEIDARSRNSIEVSVGNK